MAGSGWAVPVQANASASANILLKACLILDTNPSVPQEHALLHEPVCTASKLLGYHAWQPTSAEAVQTISAVKAPAPP
eukprot:1148208-Pelagomonas_calceolata.AAC.10